MSRDEIDCRNAYKGTSALKWWFSFKKKKTVLLRNVKLMKHHEDVKRWQVATFVCNWEVGHMTTAYGQHLQHQDRYSGRLITKYRISRISDLIGQYEFSKCQILSSELSDLISRSFLASVIYIRNISELTITWNTKALFITSNLPSWETCDQPYKHVSPYLFLKPRQIFLITKTSYLWADRWPKLPGSHSSGLKKPVFSPTRLQTPSEISSMVQTAQVPSPLINIELKLG